MSDAETHRFEIVRDLTHDELLDLDKQCRPLLRRLHKRYASDIAVSNGFLATSDYLDILRTSWRLDTRKKSRPEPQAVTIALGYGFGLLLAEKLKMRWSIIRDSYGESVSMVYEARKADPSRPSSVSISPFSFVTKREHVENTEVFGDGLRTFRKFIRGGSKAVKGHDS